MTASVIRELVMIIRSLLLFVILHLLPFKILLWLLRRRLEVNGYKFYPEISGRVSLYKLALTLNNFCNKRVALVPDYICNVVNVALEAAGYEVQTYPTDCYFEPLESELAIKLADERINILLTASVYGSSAFLDGLKKQEFRELILKRNIYVIVDLCQDISLVQHLPTNYGINLSAVVSFNDKSFPGVMGGGILTKMNIPITRKRMNFVQRLTLYRMLLAKCKAYMVTAFRKRFQTQYKAENLVVGNNGEDKNQYSYSYCQVFPYRIEPFRIEKIQIILALIGFANLKLINRKKSEFAKHVPNVLRTKYYETSPYLVLISGEHIPPLRKRKHPYACHGNPKESLRGALIIIHNKGFYDEEC